GGHTSLGAEEVLSDGNDEYHTITSPGAPRRLAPKQSCSRTARNVAPFLASYSSTSRGARSETPPSCPLLAAWPPSKLSSRLRGRRSSDTAASHPPAPCARGRVGCRAMLPILALLAA